MAAPGAISVGLTGRTALADDHDQLSAFRDMTPETWAALLQEPLDVRVIRVAYDNPSPQGMRNVADSMYDQEVITRDDRSKLILLIDALLDSGLGSMEEIRQRISAVVDDLHEGVNKVTDAIGVIMMGALDVVRRPYEDSALDRILQRIAAKVILAMEGIITMGSLLRAVGQNPSRHPLALMAGAFLYAAQTTDNETIIGN